MKGGPFHGHYEFPSNFEQSNYTERNFQTAIRHFLEYLGTYDTCMLKFTRNFIEDRKISFLLIDYTKGTTTFHFQTITSLTL